MNVRLHIERLVLDGFAMTPSERTHFVNAAQAELGRLLTLQGVSTEVAAGFATPAVSGGTIRPAAAPFDPVSFGNEVARAVYRGMGGEPE